ncbi:MAG: O-methyltransferase [Solirubrobacteraceae bacterium]
MGRSRHCGSLLHGLYLEYALCLHLVPDRLQLPSVSLPELSPAASTITIAVDAVPEGGWRTMLDDLVYLLKIARLTAARNVLELGSYRGLTAAYLVRNVAEGGRVVAVDIDPNHGVAYRGSELEALIERRTGPLEPALFTAEEEGWYDLIFVDAGHTFEDVRRDSELAMRLIAPDGCIVWHDYINSGYFNGFNEVPELLHHLAASKRIIHLEGSTLAVHSPRWTLDQPVEKLSLGGPGVDDHLLSYTEPPHTR